MKTFMYGVILLFYGIAGYSQSLSNQVIANGGNSLHLPQVGTVSWTIGELFVKTYQGDIDLTQGFQQAYNVVINSLQTSKDATLTFQVFPNPATDYFFVDPNQNGPPSHATLFNLVGQPLQQLLLNGQTKVDLSLYPAGMYLLQIQGSDGLLYAYKIQKQ